MSYPIADRVSTLAAYPFAVIDAKVSELRAKGVAPVDFGVGDPTLPTPAIVRERCRSAVEERASSGYPSYIGSVEFRTAAADWMQARFGVELDPVTQVTTTIGSKEGIFHFPLGFVNPGDVVICPSPGYPPYARGTAFAGGEPYFVPLLKENGFLPDLEAIPAEIVERARLIWLCYPNAPTGANAPESFFRDAIAWGRANEVVVINDEAYIDLYFGDEPPASILRYGVEGVVSFFSMSKRSAMTGWRVGWTAGDADIIATFRKVKTNVDSGAPTFLQDASIAALKDESHVVEMRADYRAKRDLLAETFAELGFEASAPEATIHYWQRLPEGLGAVTFAERLLDPAIAVVCTPGPWVSDVCADGTRPGDGYVRFSLVPHLKDTRRACEAILANRAALLA
jgi:LL-diaminopimelate aminotransferase